MPPAGLSEVATSDGLRLAVHDLGGEGPPLLLSHATGFHGRVWEPFAAALADRFHCWSWDFRGHGDSPTPEGHPFDWERFADDVLAVVDGLGLDGPVPAVGHSKGGASLLLAEARRPGTFSALFCYEPIIFPTDPPPGPVDAPHNPLVEVTLRRRSTFPSFEEALANFAMKPPLDVLHPDAVEAYVRHGFREEPDGSVALKCRAEDEAQMYRMGSAHPAWGRLPEIACPVAVACGEHGMPIDPAAAAHLASRLPHGEAVVFDGLGHFGPLTHPADVAARAAEWFADG